MRARARAGFRVKAELEVDALVQFDEALASYARPDAILPDTFTLPDVRAAVARARGRLVLEASGGIALETVGEGRPDRSQRDLAAR
ncbi:MAG: hypothetical protein ACREM2_00875 [Vulcanimicrobiaceae bacterium]